jgi:tRNA threonylcarbamoyl adenosine modification protein YeaZ
MKLALDCTNGHLTWAISEDYRIIASETFLSKKDVAEYFPEKLSHTFVEIGKTPLEIQEIISVAGPGGFSGVRTGTSLIEGMNAVLKKPIISLSSLQALALSISDPQGNIITMLNARREGVYLAVYDAHYQILVPEQLCDISQAESLVQPFLTKKYHLAGHGVGLLSHVWNQENTLSAIECSDAKNFILNIDKSHLHATHHRPIYMRPPDAVRSKKKAPIKGGM